MDLAVTVRPPRHARPEDLPTLAERDMLTAFAARLDTPPLAPKAVRLARDGDTVIQIDGVSPDEDLFVIPNSHPGSLPEGLAPYLARDVFSLSLVTAERPGARAVLLFASPVARQCAESLVGAMAKDAGIDLEDVDLGLEWTERLIEATRPAGRHRA